MSPHDLVDLWRAKFPELAREIPVDLVVQRAERESGKAARWVGGESRGVDAVAGRDAGEAMSDPVQIGLWTLTREPTLVRAVRNPDRMQPEKLTVELDDDELAIEADGETCGMYVPFAVLAQLWAWHNERKDINAFHDECANGFR